MKLCLVGYGAIASKHMEAFREIPGVRPAWLVGRREEQTAKFAATWGFDNWTLDLDRVLADTSVDAVVIASPNAHHVEHFVGQFTMVRRENVTADGKPRSWTDNLLRHHGA
ncbi:MAG: Gfo/Idh/MocA family oxidoreductase, partial [Spirochaetota bacterium]